MYFDGAVNSAGSRVGATLISPDKHQYPIAAKVDFSCTNNVAKYEACIIGLQAAIDFKVKELEVFGDSMLTIFQTLGQWKKKDAKLIPYHEYLEELAKSFEKNLFTYTPHTKNQFADALASQRETSSSPLRSRSPMVRPIATQSKQPTLSRGARGELRAPYEWTDARQEAHALRLLLVHHGDRLRKARQALSPVPSLR
ncbi:hypothetical protein CRG98_017861 [Punica granatum]|uniref:RNase H type-1 domain-containing protein n=1 Tax=Punica granatum TaxID=22663 RepID=A0A2I0JZL3_PUNGR|nr:hypothetical protein CRG98_017861 [Punica granatum]